MSFIRYKKFGKKEYAYKIEAYWDKEKQKPRQKTTYLGMVIDAKTKKYERKVRKKPEKLILDFGDTYSIDKFLEESKLKSIFSNTFKGQEENLYALLCYRLCHGGAMRYAQNWADGNYASLCYKNAALSSQKNSNFLAYLGDEKLQRMFFSKYIPQFCNPQKGIIIDGTSLPNEIHMPLTAWGLHGEEIDKQIRFLLIVDKESACPMLFRCLPGNILDISTLKNTIDELKRYGIQESFAYLDAGFFSQESIGELYDNNIQFLTRLPSLRILYKELIHNELHDIETVSHLVRYGKRALFVKQKTIDLFGRKAFAHIVQDPERKGRETKNCLLDVLDEKEQHTEQDLAYLLKTRGIMILVSSFRLEKNEVVPAYYTRQMAEKLFGFSKDDLNLLPLRVHNEQTCRGYLFLLFLTLAVFVMLKKKLGQRHTVEEMLLSMRNLKCKVYDNEIVVQEATKQQKQFLELFGILMPKIVGI